MSRHSVRAILRPWQAKVFFAAAAAILASEARYINWRPVVPPVDTQPLLVRKDAKGDGRFHAPRSGNRLHRGIDVAAPLEAPVRTIRSGTVLEVGTHRGLGQFVVVQHSPRLRSLYAHLSRTDVARGARVAQGAVIGAVGKTGNAKSHWITPHLHLEVVRDGEPIDPQTLGLRIVLPALAGSDTAMETSADVGGDE